MKKLNYYCQKHGDLEQKDIQQTFNDNYKNGYYTKCKICELETAWKQKLRTCKKHGLLKAEDIKPNGYCRKCHRESANKKRNENREEFNKKIAEDKKKNPQKWKKIYADAYERRVKNEGRTFLNTKEICRLRGITYDEYEKMFEFQKGKCAICNEPERCLSRDGFTIKRLCLDHNHKTGNIRGLLCHDCNTGIGKFKDDPDMMMAAMLYLEEHSEISIK